MNLRTFLPPSALETADPPAVGDPAPPGFEGPAVIAFRRHTGCPFAEATLRALRDLAGDVTVIAVSHAPEEATARWCEAVGGAGEVRLVSDPDRTAYAAWGLGRSSLTHFMGRRSLGEVAKLARQGVRNRHPDGSRWQQAGTFAIDAHSTVVWRHLPAHAGELPDLAAALHAAAG